MKWVRIKDLGDHTEEDCIGGWDDPEHSPAPWGYHQWGSSSGPIIGICPTCGDIIPVLGQLPLCGKLLPNPKFGQPGAGSRITCDTILQCTVTNYRDDFKKWVCSSCGSTMQTPLDYVTPVPKIVRKQRAMEVPNIGY